MKDEATKRELAVFQITEKDVLDMLDTLGGGYPIAHTLRLGDAEDAYMYVRTRLEESTVSELEWLLTVFLEELRAQREKDRRRIR